MKNNPEMPSLPTDDQASHKASAPAKTSASSKAAPVRKTARASKAAEAAAAKLDKLFKRVRPAKKQSASPAPAQEKPARKPGDKMVLIAVWGVLGLVLVSLLIVMSAQRRAENIPSALDQSLVKGLAVDRVFTPNTGKRYVQISEGMERNVSVQESGSTLPVISRYNFKALTKQNYEVIGAAPWALSINIDSNKNDAELLRYLFNQDDMIKSFLARQEVAPLLSDPKALAQVAADEQAVKAFFASDAVAQVLNDPALFEAFTGSRFMAYLLISKSGKYYRDHPQEAAKIIQASPTLRALKQSAAVRKAVSENTYLKKIAPTLLK